MLCWPKRIRRRCACNSGVLMPVNADGLGCRCICRWCISASCARPAGLPSKHKAGMNIGHLQLRAACMLLTGRVMCSGSKKNRRFGNRRVPGWLRDLSCSDVFVCTYHRAAEPRGQLWSSAPRVAAVPSTRSRSDEQDSLDPPSTDLSCAACTSTL